MDRESKKSQTVFKRRLQAAFNRGKRQQYNLMVNQGWAPPPPDGGISQEDVHPAYYFFSGLAIGLTVASVIWCLWGRQLMSIMGGQYG